MHLGGKFSPGASPAINPVVGCFWNISTDDSSGINNSERHELLAINAPS